LAVAPAPARPRAGGGRFLIIIGLLVAVAAGGGVFLYGTLFGGGGGGVLSGGTFVVVAAQAIPVRHQITDADLTTTKINPVLPNTYTQTKDVKGLISELFISKGSLITSDMLARDVGLIPAGSAPAYLPLASGYVAMTIPTGEQQGVAGHITLGDYITVIASANVVIPPAAAKIVSKTVFTNIHIIELTQCDAEFMTWFLGNMTIRYTLESFNDYLKQPPTTADPTCQTIKDAHGVSFKTVDDKYGFSKL
jgi:hypothetical protein